jgi:hypothetical protein
LNRFNTISAGKEAAMVLHDVQGATILNSRGPTAKWIETRGNSKDVSVR